MYAEGEKTPRKEKQQSGMGEAHPKRVKKQSTGFRYALFIIVRLFFFSFFAKYDSPIQF
ncbi:MAG: hypothetical protein II804_06225 [Clostridia bacterium]|nr:hypothetical protein [Clostridia bacterium]